MICPISSGFSRVFDRVEGQAPSVEDPFKQSLEEYLVGAVRLKDSLVKSSRRVYSNSAR